MTARTKKIAAERIRKHGIESIMMKNGSTAKGNIHGKAVYLVGPDGALCRTQLKNAPTITPVDTKVFSCMIMSVHMLRWQSKTTCKHSI